MQEYHKIQTLFLRDPATNYKTLLMGKYAKPEFEYLKDCQWRFTEKVDGTNIRVMIDVFNRKAKIEYGGKTDNAMIPAKLIVALDEIFAGLKNMLPDIFPDGACLYGEGFGTGIQKGGGNYRPTPSFVLFDVKVGDYWLEWDNVVDVAIKLRIEYVPTVHVGTLNDMVDFVQNGFTSCWGDFMAEGLVGKPATELFNRNGERIITKLKYKDFHRPANQQDAQ
jgi:hypothetical protein